MNHAFIYTWETGLTDLGTTPGMANSYAYAINTNGQIVGVAIVSNNRDHAFLYSTGIMMDLGTLGGTSCNALSNNNSGQVVWLSETTNGQHAFLYSGAKMTDLNDLIPANPGWTLTQAKAINDSGQIVGFGFNPSGQGHAFLLSPVPVLHRATASAVACRPSATG